MLPTRDQIEGLHHKYAPNEVAFRLVFEHCQIVAEIAQWCTERIQNTAEINTELLQTACLLHDIGAYAFYDEQGERTNKRLYKQHALLGAKIVSDEGIDQRVADLIETHVLMGLSKQEIIESHIPLPARDYSPITVEGELLCYADRFHSKRPVFNDYETFLQYLEEDMPIQAKKFKAAADRFGIPDIQALATKYQQPIS